MESVLIKMLGFMPNEKAVIKGEAIPVTGRGGL
jgi:hypothetical protein